LPNLGDLIVFDDRSIVDGRTESLVRRPCAALPATH